MQVTKDPSAYWCEHCDNVLTHNRIELWGEITGGGALPHNHVGEFTAVTFALCNECIEKMLTKVRTFPASVASGLF